MLIVGCSTEASEKKVEVECPSGIVNDESPGMCGLYTDENENGICDYSEPK